MTPACGRCGARAIAYVNGVGRQCLMCGEEHAQDDRGGAVAVEVDAKVVQDQEDAGKVTVRAAAKALGLRYKLVLQWARTGELPATDWDPRQSRRGRRVRLADLEELVRTSGPSSAPTAAQPRGARSSPKESNDVSARRRRSARSAIGRGCGRHDDAGEDDDADEVKVMPMEEVNDGMESMGWRAQVRVSVVLAASRAGD